MKLAFLTLPEDERRLYIEQAAVRRSLSPVVLEKDFWVCWLLGPMEKTVFRQFLGELRPGQTRHVSPRSDGPAVALAAARLSGHAGYVSLGACEL